CKFIFIRRACIWTEGPAVAALVAHVVHMDHLRHIHSRNLNGDIRTVRTYVHTVFTDFAAVQTSLRLAFRVFFFSEDALLSVAFFLCSCHSAVGNHLFSDNSLCRLLCVTDGFHDRSCSACSVSNEIYVIHAGFHCFRIQFRFAPLVYIHAHGLVEFGGNFFAHSHDHGISRNFHSLFRFCHTGSSGCVHLAQDHLPAAEISVSH